MVQFNTRTQAAETTKTAPGTFNNLVKPFFKEYCTRCHGEKKQKADYAIHDIDYRIGDGKDLDRWQKALEMMSLGDMPPQKKKVEQPGRAERKRT